MRQKKSKIATAVLWISFPIAVILLFITLVDVSGLLAKPITNDQTPQKADVIIVLGGGIVTDLKILPWSVQERMKRGVELFDQGYADRMIVAGGQVSGQSYSESEFMREYAEFLGVPSKSIIEENASRDTHQNAQNSLVIMNELGWSTALVVTSDYHTRRACNVFEKQSAEVTCIASYKSENFNNLFRNLTDTRAVVCDYLATVYYLIRGYI